MPAASAKPPRAKKRGKLLAIIVAVVAVVAVALTAVVIVLNRSLTPTEQVLHNYFAAIEDRDVNAMFNLSVLGAIPDEDVALLMRARFEQYMRDGVLDMWGLVGNTSHRVQQSTYWPANSVDLPADYRAATQEFAEQGVVIEEFARLLVRYTINATQATHDTSGTFTVVRVGDAWHLMLDPYFFWAQ